MGLAVAILTGLAVVLAALAVVALVAGA